MKILKRILTVFAVLNWVSYILSFLQIALLEHFSSVTQPIFDIFIDLLDYPLCYSVFFSPFVFFPGLILSVVMVVNGLKNPKNSLKTESILFAAYALCAVPLSYFAFCALMSV